MDTKRELRARVRSKLETVKEETNRALTGPGVSELKEILERLGGGNGLPHWYGQLAENGTLPNLDGKTIGSVVEMVFVAVLERYVLSGRRDPLSINPAAGVDLPDLDLGVKSPSENYCTSEPYFSAYERLLGSEYDIVALLTDYQTSKENPPLRLQIMKVRYLFGHELADKGLCEIARTHREWLMSESEARTRKLMRFLAYVNQSDWRAKWLLRLVEHLQDDTAITNKLAMAEQHFKDSNVRRQRLGKDPIPNESLQSLTNIREIRPLYVGTIEAADNWVDDTHRDFARVPNQNEWARLLSSPLDGKIGMSYALQWRFNFGPLFRGTG